MVESVTMSLAIGIIAVVMVVIAIRRALERRAGRPRQRVIDGAAHSNSWSGAETTNHPERDRRRSRKAG